MTPDLTQDQMVFDTTFPLCLVDVENGVVVDEGYVEEDLFGAAEKHMREEPMSLLVIYERKSVLSFKR